jgi:hypothetical protein
MASHGIFGVEKKDPNESNWFPSLFFIAGQKLACSVVDSVFAAGREDHEELWETEEWQDFRKYFHEVHYTRGQFHQCFTNEVFVRNIVSAAFL